jgi:DNA-binding beta-propeller fold protein YncE
MKKLIVLLVLLAGLLSRVFAQEPLDSLYHSAYLHLVFEYPADWSIEEDRFGVQLLNYDYDNAGPNEAGEARIQFAPGESLAELGLSFDADDLVASLETMRPIFASGDNTLGDASAITLPDGRPAARADGMFLGNSMLVLALAGDSGGVLFITGEALQDEFSTFEPLFLQVAETAVYTIPTFAEPLPAITPGNAIELEHLTDLVSRRASSGQTEHVTFNVDGSLAANARGSNGILVWDVETRELVADLSAISADEVVFDENNGLYAADFSDGLSHMGQDGEVLWQVASEDELRTVDYNAAKGWLVTGGSNGAVRLWDAETGEVVETLAESDHAIMSVAFSPDGSYLAATSLEGTAQLWKTGDEFEASELTFDDSLTGTAEALAFSGDGKRLAILGTSGVYVVFDVESGETLLSGRQVTESVYDGTLALNQDGSVLATNAADNDIFIVVDVATGEVINGFGQGGDFVSSLDFSPDGTMLLAGGFYRDTFTIWAVGE